MCGLAGFVASRPTAGGEAILRRMTEALRHRGPDDSGYYADGRAFLGHRRLSIIDPASGRQPMASDSAAVQVVYNGEIYNHASVRRDLEAAGHVYRTRCDTESLVHAYEEDGPGCVERLRGMFAFAIWDAQRQRLFCARDRLGIKPLYYAWTGRTFLFASEIKALLEHPEVRAELDREALPEYVAFGYSNSASTLFRNIRKLLPGHRLLADFSGSDPRIEIERYWTLPRAHPQGTGRSAREWEQEVGARLEAAVESHLMSDVPLGMFLSGGIDSSAIAAILKSRARGPVRTFSVGYAEAAFSELSAAAVTARCLGTEHDEITVGRADFFEALPQLIWQEDEPIAWPSSVPLYFVSKLASERVKVVLTGEGSDELFGGYERYRWQLLNARAARAWRLVPAAARQRMREWVNDTPALPATWRRRAAHTPVGRGDTLESLYLDNFYCSFGNRGPEAYASWMRNWEDERGQSPLARMLRTDLQTYLPELLMKQDAMSMAASIESRVPFLDSDFVEFAMTVPDELKIRGSQQKAVLKKAVGGLLPPEIIHRKKRGFPTPLRQWLRQPGSEWIFQTIRARDSVAESYLDRAEIEALIARHRSGEEDGTDRIWRLLNLQLWGELFLKGRAAPEAALATIR